MCFLQRFTDTFMLQTKWQSIKTNKKRVMYCVSSSTLLTVLNVQEHVIMHSKACLSYGNLHGCSSKSHYNGCCQEQCVLLSLCSSSETTAGYLSVFSIINLFIQVWYLSENMTLLWILYVYFSAKLHCLFWYLIFYLNYTSLSFLLA